MYPFSYTGLRLVHDEKVRDAMKRALIDAELARNSRRAVRLSLLRSVLKSIYSRWTLSAAAPPEAGSRPARRIINRCRFGKGIAIW
jgi:hypothetical protein